MSTQETHAICDREQCRYDGIVENKPGYHRGLGLLVIVLGILVIVTLFWTIILALGGVFLIAFGVMLMITKRMSCPACKRGGMFDISEGRGAALYARKYPSPPQD